jgi:hypothetical protein
LVKRLSLANDAALQAYFVYHQPECDHV